MALRRQKQRGAGLVTQRDESTEAPDPDALAPPPPPPEVNDDPSGAPAPLPEDLPSKHGLLGEILVEKGVIDDDQLNAALASQEDSQQRLGEMLIESEAVTEVELAEALAAQYSVSFVSLERAVLDPKSVTEIPEDLARNLKVVPLGRSGGQVSVAVADPSIDGLFGDLWAQAKSPLAFVVALPDEVDETIDNGLAMFVSGDNLRKGAALNAVQIAEVLGRECLKKG